MLKGVRVCLCSPAHPKYTYICPFCREKRAVAERFMQEYMGQHCPTTRKSLRVIARRV